MDEQSKTVLLAHGGGGRLMEDLIRRLIVPRFASADAGPLLDSAFLNLPAGRVCFTTDSFVVQPLFFPGGDIGKLAVCGTVNDLAVSGAKPIALSCGLIIEEGFAMDELERIIQSAADAANEAGVKIVTGDTKVVEKGAADGVFINTAGIGVAMEGVRLGFELVRPGDRILINGTPGDHGMTIMAGRKEISLQSPMQSDCACLNGLIEMLLVELGEDVKFMRDPTRGGLAATLNEIAASAKVSVEIGEAALPIHPAVRGAAEMLGFDLLNVANEGKVVVVVSPQAADKALEICRAHSLGRQAAMIGRVAEADPQPLVELMTKIGGRRVVQMPYGRDLPRIC